MEIMTQEKSDLLVVQHTVLVWHGVLSVHCAYPPWADTEDKQCSGMCAI